MYIHSDILVVDTLVFDLVTYTIEEQMSTELLIVTFSKIFTLVQQIIIIISCYCHVKCCPQTLDISTIAISSWQCSTIEP